MRRKHASPAPLSLFLLFLSTVSLFHVGLSVAGTGSGRKLAGDSPFTAKAALIRYWKKQVSSGLPEPFFLDKASPLDAVQLATFSKLADQNSLSTQLPTFCKTANLLCYPPDVGANLEQQSHDEVFANYKLENFTNYGNGLAHGVNSFTTYNHDTNITANSFSSYSGDSFDRNDTFTNYAVHSTEANQTFKTYGTNSILGTGEFSNYGTSGTLPIHTFTSYSDSAFGRNQDFKHYEDASNVGDATFTSYGKNLSEGTNEFTSYGDRTSVVSSTFKNYGERAKGSKDNFTSYGENGDQQPTNDFTGYGSEGNGNTESFANYRNQSTAGHDSFQSYAAGPSSGETVGFTNYGQTKNDGSSTFKGYAKDSNESTVDFKIYGNNTTFKDYANTGVTFANYVNRSGSAAATTGQKVNSRWVEPGKFFREKMLKTGTVMPMPDIKDKMPKRSFLSPVILSKLAFSSNKIHELKKLFPAADDSHMTTIMGNALSECERAPSPGETKRCVGSGEDMIDFATSVLGKKVKVRTTENTQGSGGDIMIGTVKGINSGQITKSVSCHQSLYPYLLYYCHSVPKVRVYEADILDPKSKDKINQGVAICHIDTSSWGASHGAFIALGSGPGKIEVCHWIFENDMTWTIAD